MFSLKYLGLTFWPYWMPIFGTRHLRQTALDLVLAQLSTSGHWQPLSIFLTLSDSVGALPLPKTFERVAILIDLDTRYRFQTVADLDELISTATNPEDGTLYTRLWPLAVDRLRVQIQELGQKHVLSYSRCSRPND